MVGYFRPEPAIPLLHEKQAFFSHLRWRVGFAKHFEARRRPQREQAV
jgi:hypothetical protein